MKSSEKIRIGVICQCNANKNFGWMYSYLCYPYDYGRKIHSSQMFFTFKKKNDFILQEGTLVAFISLDDAKGYAVNVIELKELPFYYSESSDDEKIKLSILNMNPFWKISYRWRFDYCCINFPCKSNKLNETQMAYKVLHGKDKEIFMLLYQLHTSSFKTLTLEEIYSKVHSIYCYVNSFSLEHVLDTYKCGESGHFQCRPGRDDSFNITHFKSINTDDNYIRSIIPLAKEEESYACVGRSDEDYYILNEEDIEKGRCIARKSYTKEKHIAYLLNSFFEEYHNKKNKYESILENIKKLKLSDSFRYENFGYGNYTQEMLSEKFKHINQKVLEEYKILRM